MNGKKHRAYVDAHIHFEGAVPEKFFLEHRESLSGDEVRRGIKKAAYADMTEFARCWSFRVGFLRSPDLIRRAAASLAAVLKKGNVGTVVMHFSSDEYMRFDIPARAVAACIRDEVRRHSIGCWLLLDCVRDNGPEHAARMVREATGMRAAGVIGIGLGGDETCLPAKDFKDVFDRARASGLVTTAHCGETDVQSVIDAVEILRVDRVVHGYQAARDQAALRLLVRKQVALEVCLTSYERMYGGTGAGSHPLTEFLASGVVVNLGSDDPDMFSTDIGREYGKARALIKGDGAPDLEFLCTSAESWATEIDRRNKKNSGTKSGANRQGEK